MAQISQGNVVSYEITFHNEPHDFFNKSKKKRAKKWEWDETNSRELLQYTVPCRFTDKIPCANKAK